MLTTNINNLDDFKQFLVKFFANKKVKIYLFGSRAKNTYTPYSDIDIAIESQEISNYDISILKEIVEESNLPYKVDIIDLNVASNLKEVVEKEGIRWI